MQPKPKLLYILAPSYSGSTLLTHLLAQNPAISTVGELKATQMGNIDEYHCSCGELIRACTFWNSVRHECAVQNEHFDVGDFGTHFRSPDWIADLLFRTLVRNQRFEVLRNLLISIYKPAKRQMQAILHRNFVLTKIITSLQSGTIFLDDSKDANRLKFLIESDLWDTHVIYLQRDGRGVTNSIKKYKQMDFSEAGDYWSISVHELERMRKRLEPQRVFELKYEDLCQAPDDWLQSIYQWLELEKSSVFTQSLNNGDLHILGNNSMRLHGVSEIRLDEKWRTALDASAQRSFIATHGALLRQIGYEF